MKHPATASLPPPLERGDRIGVAALSGPVDPDRLAAGLDVLRRLGYRPVEASNLGSRREFLAGEDGERLDAFHELAADPEVRAIVFARGGYGLTRILPRIDWELLARVPRAYVGYSDLTPFLLQVVERLGLVAFHGPMVAGDLARGLSASEMRSFEGALLGEVETDLPLAGCLGRAAGEGPLLGGCLSMLVSTLGTPYAPDLEGAVLFFEDVEEPPYRIDRMLTHLRLSDNLAQLEGMVAGHLICSTLGAQEVGEQASGSVGAGRQGPDGVANRRVSEPVEVSLGERFSRELAGEFGWPVGWGLCSGHTSPNLTLPLGAWARLDPDRRVLSLRRTPGRQVVRQRPAFSV